MCLRISMIVAACLSLLDSTGLGADAPALKTVRVASREEVSSWKLKFETLAEFKFAMDRATQSDGVVVRAADTMLFGALIESKKTVARK